METTLTMKTSPKSVNGKMSPVEPQNIKNRLTSENLSELGSEKNQLEMGYRQILLDPKIKAWVDKQNKISKEKGPRYGRPYNEGEDSMYPVQQQIYTFASMYPWVRFTMIS